ncbi:protein FAR1-RELATED SEQUENCE 5-like [Apium graveolens]|uniref:protein FAR1-RELATED SEQUENCE 5-like n=1 Tax=Apium graveolens TaxID=4045 RepID=UPI003D78D679
MYAIRTQWIGAYMKQHFSADMTTTSRSESTNSFFDEYVQSSTGLKEFIENSQKALETQYLKEVKADYDSEQLEMRLVLHSSLEMHASEIYTKEMFKRFQKELMKSTCYIVNSVKNNGTYMSKLYLVEKATLPENCRRKYRVTVFMYEKIQCSCKKFEHSGMICKHIIRYLDKKQKIKIPKSLIIGRWIINGNKIAGPLPYAPPGIGNDGASQPLRYGALCKSFQDLASSGSCSVSRYKYLMGVIDREKRYLKDAFADEEHRERTHEVKTQEDYQHDPIFDLPTLKTKGRKKTKRYKSGIETATSKIKIKPKKCNYCGAIGGEHDARNCPLREEHDRRNF